MRIDRTPWPKHHDRMWTETPPISVMGKVLCSLLYDVRFAHLPFILERVEYEEDL